MNAFINGTLKLVENEIKFKAVLNKNLGEIPLTMGYPGGFSQVIMNLLVNASHAIEDFGEITISTEKIGDSIIVNVSDNGSGVSDDNIDKIFNAFFTTKEVGVGTGLGLSISAGIIKDHGGKIEVDSQLVSGSCFTITLPIIDTQLD